MRNVTLLSISVHVSTKYNTDKTNILLQKAEISCLGQVLMMAVGVWLLMS